MSASAPINIEWAYDPHGDVSIAFDDRNCISRGVFVIIMPPPGRPVLRMSDAAGLLAWKSQLSRIGTRPAS
jgi:hypothetical protein